jgi:purine nucleosidase
MGRRIIIDCDPGTDDALALWLALASPELDVLAVTVAGGNVGLDLTLPNALAIMALAGSRAPVHAGADRPLLGAFRNETDVHGADGLGGVVLPPGERPAPELAADALRGLLRQAAESITLVGIGPATNQALALATEPALAAQVEQIVLMSGAWSEGNITPSAEFNAWSDPEALTILLASGCPIRMVTLELTAQALVTPERVAALRRHDGGKCLEAACDILAGLPPSPRLGRRGAALHDPCTIAWLIRPDLFTARQVSVSVELAGAARGRTIIDRWQRSGAAANVTLLETLDAAAFFNLLGERLATLP